MDIINYSKVKKLEEKVNTNKAEVATFKEDYVNLEGLVTNVIDGEIQDVLNNELVATDIANKLNAKEIEYAPRLTKTEAHTKFNNLALPPAKIGSAQLTSNYTGVFPINFIDGVVYGFANNTTIVKSTDDGATWQNVATSPYGSVHCIFFCVDGEVIIANNGQVSKSTGWATNPSTAIWTTKVNISGGVGILPWSIDGDGNKFIVTEYSGADRSESRYIWISTDMGDTFNIVYDKFITDPTNTSHMHGVCYDKWADRFFVSHGHGVIRGTYYSDDNGITWDMIGGDFQPDAAPTTLTATDNGIVCGSDSGDGGIYGITRTEKPEDMRIQPLVRWVTPRQGVSGFAYSTFRDESTGMVYIGFKSDFSDVKSVIMAGSATTGSLVYESIAGGTQFPCLVVTDKSIIGVIDRLPVKELIRALKPSPSNNIFDKGNILSGVSRNNLSIAIGNNVNVTTANEVVIGSKAKIPESISGIGNVVIGESAVGYARAVAIGQGATANNHDTVVIGKGSINGGANGVAIGLNSLVDVNGTNGVAIGNGAKAQVGSVSVGQGANNGTASYGVSLGAGATTGSASVAIGNNASAGTNQIAIGKSAKSQHLNSIALGNDTTTTRENQLQIGARHIEMKKVDEPVTVPADSGRLFIKDDGTGKLQFCVRLGDTTIVLATQA